MHSLTLFIPGLLAPAGAMSEQDIPRLPALEKILARSSREQLVPFGFSDALCMLFKLNCQAGQDYPIGAITRLVDDDHAVEGIWMRADPVHLAADRKGLILFDQTTFTLDQHDALVLAASVRELLAEHGMQLEVPTIERWYVQMENLPTVKTTPLHEATGRDIHELLPTGTDQMQWSQLLNEIQMTLHACAVNTTREQNGERAINSLWFWGAGRLPELPACMWTQVYSDEEIAKGFATLARVPCKELPDSLEKLIDNAAADEDALVVMSFGLRHAQYHDLRGWQDFVNYLEELWFADLEDALRTGELEELTLLTEHQQFTLRKKHLRKFWRRPVPLSRYAN